MQGRDEVRERVTADGKPNNIMVAEAARDVQYSLSEELPAQIQQVLEEHQLAWEAMVRRQHVALRSALERVCLVADPTRVPPAAEPPGGQSSAQLPSGPLVTHAVAAKAPEAEALPERAASGDTGGPARAAPGQHLTSDERKPGLSQEKTRPSQEPENEDALGTSRVSKWFNQNIGRPASRNRFVQVLIQGPEQPLPTGSIRSRLRGIVEHSAFDLFIGCLIVLNTVIMFVQLEAEAPFQDGGHFIEAIPHPVFAVVAHIFNVIFSLELTLRLYVKRCHFFLVAFNWLDVFIVLLTLFDAYILSMVSGADSQNLSFMRMVRFIRVVRALRVIRTMSLFRQLRVLLNTIAMSFMSLFWSMLILFIFMLMFSLFMCQMLSSFMLDYENTDIAMKEWVFRFYGSSLRALYTVFEITFSGGWPQYARPLVENVQAYYAIFFAFYITGVVFAMVRIVSALFLKDTLQIAANDADMMISEKTKEIRNFASKLSEMFKQADESGDGFLSGEELKQIMTYPKVKVWMSVLGLDVSDTNLLFNMLDDGDGLISYDEFLSGIMRLKGGSRSQDTIRIMRDCERISRSCEATREDCQELLHVLGIPGRKGQKKLTRSGTHPLGSGASVQSPETVMRANVASMVQGL